MVSIFIASEKFDSDLELDAWMHKTHGYGWSWAWAWVWAPNVGLWSTPLSLPRLCGIYMHPQLTSDIRRRRRIRIKK